MGCFGIVDSQGRIRFSGGIQQCRRFLRQLGMECDIKGWHGNGYRGILEYWENQYHATAWRA